jgi:tetratricopeptide (TPR) repeat protein
MFVFRKKNQDSKQIDPLLRLLKKDPENTKVRLRLADLYLRGGDKASAISEYQKAAEYLRGEGFNLKAISMYKRIFTLDGMSLEDYKSMASVYREEGLLAEASQTYHKILQIEPQNQEARTALNDLERDRGISLDEQPHDASQDHCLNATDDVEPVPIETLLAPSHGQETLPDPTNHSAAGTFHSHEGGDLSDQGENPEEATAPHKETDVEIDLSDVRIEDLFKNAESSDEQEAVPRAIPDHELLPDTEIDELTRDEEIPEHEEDPENGASPTIDLENLWSGEVPGISRPANNEEPDSEEPRDRNPIHDPLAENLGETASISENENEPHLHYHLGVAYREMDLTDKAIKEFTRALDQGHNSLDCLIMLARCHFEKGLFKEAAAFIHQALGLEGLTLEQIDLLNQQLEDVEVAGKLD